MGIHEWARQALEQNLQAAPDMDETLVLRALLSAVVERSKALRTADDLAAELQFLADNLDDGRDYSFMRP